MGGPHIQNTIVNNDWEYYVFHSGTSSANGKLRSGQQSRAIRRSADVNGENSGLPIEDTGSVYTYTGL